MTRIEVPVTPDVLDWAIRESGYSFEEVAEKIHVHRNVIQAWLDERALPTLTNVRELARVLKRTPSTFLLPAPPQIQPVTAQFRRPSREKRKEPNPEERRYLREAARLQDAKRWVIQRLGQELHKLPLVSFDTNPERVAQNVRRTLTGRTNENSDTAAQTFRARRSAVDALGIAVFLFPMGPDSAAGFSLWDESAPVIAINTSLNHAARSYTLFHEYGHLLTRTSSLCLERSGSRLSKPTDIAERWCEEFAAAILLPWSDVANFLKRRFGWRSGETVSTLDVPKAIANEFRVSWRAATIRLIGRDVASWELYRRIPPVSDDKGNGGRAEVARDRGVVREEQYGHSTINLFIQALDRNILARADVLDYLDLTDAALDRLERDTVLLNRVDE